MAGQGFGPLPDDVIGGASRDRAAADDGLDVVFGHEVHGPLAGADHGLPGLHRQGPGPRHQGQFLQGVAAVGDVGRQLVVFAFVGEGLLVEGFHYDLNLFLEQLRLASLSVLVLGAPKVSTSREW